MLLDIERGINGKSAAERLAARQELSAPVLANLKDWMRAKRGKLSRHSSVARAMDYMLKRWEMFARFEELAAGFISEEITLRELCKARHLTQVSVACELDIS